MPNENEDFVKVVVQIGFSRRPKESQEIKAWVNEDPCKWSDNDGIFLTSLVDKNKGMLWYLWTGNLSEGDIIRVESKVFVTSVGFDERRTFEALYCVDPEAPVNTISIRGIGHKKTPVLKGRLIEVAQVSEQDQREENVEAFLEEGF